MSIRTDLAIEENIGQHGIKSEKRNIGDVEINTVEITDKKAAKELRKNIGKYITVEFPSIDKIADYGEIKSALKEALASLVPENLNNVLVVGLGNDEITADSIGPRTAARILATRHIVGEFAEKIGLRGLHSVSVITPNVMGKTGIETSETVAGLVERVKPQALIIIDSLATRNVNLLFKIFQICDAGISPGSGVKNSRKELSRETLGVPVIAVGVPTVVDAMALAYELTGKETITETDMIVTPKDADILCHRISEIIAESLNVFLQPEIEEEVIMSLV